MSIPNFIIGLLAIIILASWLKVINVLPDWNRPIDWLVPGLVLAAMPMAAISRITRETFLNTLGEDYVRTARAKGLNERQVIIFHVLRNAAVPVLISLGPAIMEMFVGLFIIENLYSFPGMGKLYWYAVVELDYPLILGLTLVYAVFIILVNSITEILAEAIDPRIRHTKKEAAA
jgi:oligopeptide transport system permease protein